MQEIMVSTDGGRYTLPLPDSRVIDEATRTVDYSITERDVRLARLIQTLSAPAGYTVDQAIALGGLRVVTG